MTKAGTEAFAGGRYVVERRLGSGGMAVVYLARDSELDRDVAVKALGDPLAADDRFVERFRREATTAAGLSHPNVVQVYDFGEEEHRLFIVMELVEGESLSDVLRAEGRLPVERVLDIAGQACRALAYAHGEGVVHRDVKPANLLLRSDGVLKVADFGIARAGEEATQLTQAGTVLGTASYLSPEQAAGEAVTNRADLYSLGVVLYELLTSRTPRRIETLAQLASLGEEPIRPLRDLASEVPEHVEATVMRCLARNPRYRPDSAAKLAAELEGAEATRPLTAAAAPTVPLERGRRPTGATTPLTRRRSWTGRRGSIAAAVALVAALAILTAVVTAGGGDGNGAQPAENQPRTSARVASVPQASDPAGKAQNLADWLRSHTKGGG